MHFLKENEQGKQRHNNNFRLNLKQLPRVLKSSYSGNFGNSLKEVLAVMVRAYNNLQSSCKKFFNKDDSKNGCSIEYQRYI